MTAIFLWLGGAIFVVLGFIHALYTLLDTLSPRRIVPADLALIEAMKANPVRLARGGTDMWNAWVGFNLSHSIGAMLFGGVCIYLGVMTEAYIVPANLVLLPVLVGGLYLALAARYWFRVPLAACALAFASFVAAWAFA